MIQANIRFAHFFKHMDKSHCDPWKLKLLQKARDTLASKLGVFFCVLPDCD